MKHTLIVQGGGFRTGFSAGVLDAFLENNFTDFDFYLGNSGGAIALSYFIAHQQGQCLEALKFMATDPNFLSYYRLLTVKGMMDVDYFNEVATIKHPFDLVKAMHTLKDKRLAFILTNMETGQPNYMHPNIENWLDTVIGSCTLPFVTKGRHSLNNEVFMDGGWSDPLPAQWAHQQGAKNILIVRTLPANLKMKQSWIDYFGSFFHYANPALSKAFANNHMIYNNSIDFINNPPEGLVINQIAPPAPLNAGTYSNSIIAIEKDYIFGFQSGMEYLKKI